MLSPTDASACNRMSGCLHIATIRLRPADGTPPAACALEDFVGRLEADLPPRGLPSPNAQHSATGPDAKPAGICATLCASADGTPSGEGGKMFTKRTILLAAGSLLTAFLSNVDPGNRALAQEPAARQQ